MIIIFINLPNDIKHKDIVGLINPIIKPGFFGAKGEVKGVELLELQDGDTNGSEYQSLIDVVPSSIASTIIEKLNGKFFKQKQIRVKQYFERSQADRRSAKDRTISQFEEKRKSSTRRRNLHMKIIPPLLIAAS